MTVDEGVLRTKLFELAQGFANGCADALLQTLDESRLRWERARHLVSELHGDHTPILEEWRELFAIFEIEEG